MTASLQAKLHGPTPKPVVDAMGVIADYLRRAGYVHVIIGPGNDGGYGAVFRLDSVYDQMAELNGALAELTAALRALYDAQNGPPLLRKKNKDAWDAAMAEAERLLGLKQDDTKQRARQRGDG